MGRLLQNANHIRNSPLTVASAKMMMRFLQGIDRLAKSKTGSQSTDEKF
ncbi:MAG: hypothetical protein IPM14_00475 [bacterium]|nr:hypothetical protein [bacterium]